MSAKGHPARDEATKQLAIKRRRGRPRKDEDLNIQQKLLEQMQLLRHIQMRAKLSNVEIERELRASPRIGLTDGNQGKYWRRWANGEYLCAPTKLQEIRKIATKKGWLNVPNPQTGSFNLTSFSADQWKKIVRREVRIAKACEKIQTALTDCQETLLQALSDETDMLEAGAMPQQNERCVFEGALLEIQELAEKINKWGLLVFSAISDGTQS